MRTNGSSYSMDDRKDTHNYIELEERDVRRNAMFVETRCS